MNKLSNTEAEFKKSVAYKRKRIIPKTWLKPLQFVTNPLQGRQG